ncbi:MAG: MFS transporter, partial [Mycobacterium sp.]
LLIGLAPTASSIGPWAAALLVALRIVQGLALGAESGVVAGFLSESAGGRGRGSLTAVYAATATIGTLIGSLLGVLLTHTLSVDQLTDWGWRIPFLLGGVLGVTAFFVRRGAAETFDPAENREPHPLRTIWREHRSDALRTVAAGSVVGLVFFTFIAGFPSLAVLIGADGRTAFLATSLGLAITVPLNIFFGGLSDRIGRRRVLIGGYIAMAAGAPAVIALMWNPNAAWKVYLAQLAIAVTTSVPGGVTTAAMVERFPPRLRASGFAFVWAVTMATFGGTGPIIATWLAARGLTFTMSSYLIVLYVAAGIAVWTMREVAFSETPWEDAAQPAR